MKRALIIGIGGQDGSYLAELLLEKDYEVHGIYRRVSNYNNLQRIEHIKSKLTLHQGDLTDTISVLRAIWEVRPDDVYNLADQDNQGWSYETPGYTYDVTGAAVGRLLQGMRECFAPSLRFFQPVSATMFGNATPPQDENTPLDPQSPYACAKAFAYHLCRFYRQRYGMFVSTGIMYNHDSPRRSDNYLLHKICASALRIQRGEQDYLELSNFGLLVDIGHAREYAMAAWRILQHSEPDDFVIATGEPYTVQVWARFALEQCGTSAAERLREVPALRVNQPTLIGNPVKARRLLGFQPELTGKRLVEAMLLVQDLSE